MPSVYLVILILVPVLVVVATLLLRKRKPRIPRGTATYSGAIRVTDRHGRNMKIIQKENGTFEMTEEKES